MVDWAKVSSKGRVTIPKRVREALGLEPGTRARFDIQGRHAVLSKLTTADNAYFRGIEETLSEWHSDSDEKAYGSL